jgi:asparagine synthase (glutamine-hydrolysing)
MASHARVALTGWDGDALMCEPPRHYFRWLLGNRRFWRLAGDMAWYVRQKRALPPVGFRTWVKRKLGRYPVRTVYPSWLDPSFAKRAGLRARWEWAHEEKGPGHPTHPSAHQMLSVPNWWFLFESYDPGVTGVALEARHPLTDRRLVEFVLGIPPVPWCVDKHILRVAMTGVLPQPVLGRPKSPLAGDPALERLRTNPAEGPEAIAPSARLANYVAPGAMPRVSGVTGSDALWLDLRPHCLDRWLAHCAPRRHEVERHARMEPSDTAVPMQG